MTTYGEKFSAEEVKEMMSSAMDADGKVCASWNGDPRSPVGIKCACTQGWGGRVGKAHCENAASVLGEVSQSAGHKKA